MLKEKFVGCLIGLAVGDALGMQTEGMSRKEIQEKLGIVRDYGISRASPLYEKLRPGQYTDDTEQMILLAESIDSNGFNIEDFADKIKEWGKKIVGNPALDRGAGPTSLWAARRLIAGADWRKSGGLTPTCGSAMRVAPIGLFYHKNIESVVENARISSLPTHSSREAKAGAISVAVGVALALKEKNPEAILNEAAEYAGREDKRLAEKIILALELREKKHREAMEIIGNSYLVYDTVPAALYCFAKYADNFEEAVLAAVNGGGDTDSIAGITGAMSGARNGVNAIPLRWIEPLEDREKIKRLAIRIWEISG